MYHSAYTCSHMHSHAHLSTLMHTHAHTCIQAHTCTHKHRLIHTCTYITCVYTYICEHGQSCSYLYTHVHVYAFLSTHVYTCKVAIQDIWQRFFPVFFFFQIFLRTSVMNTGQNLPSRPMWTVPVGLLSHSCSSTFFLSAGNKPRTLCMLYKALYH